MDNMFMDFKDFNLGFVDYDRLYEKIPNRYQLTQTIIKIGHNIIRNRQGERIDIKTAIQMAIERILNDDYEVLEQEFSLDEKVENFQRDPSMDEEYIDSGEEEDDDENDYDDDDDDDE